MSNPAALISDKELTQLKEEVLKAIVNEQPLPGSMNSLTFPDLHFVLSQSNIYLIDNNIKNTIYIEKLNKPVQVVSEETLKQEADKVGKVIYLQFQTAELESDILMLSLEAKVLSPILDYRKMNLSNMQMKFKKEGGDWKMIDLPISLSS